MRRMSLLEFQVGLATALAASAVSLLSLRGLTDDDDVRCRPSSGHLWNVLPCYGHP